MLKVLGKMGDDMKMEEVKLLIASSPNFISCLNEVLTSICTFTLLTLTPMLRMVRQHCTLQLRKVLHKLAWCWSKLDVERTSKLW